MRRLLLPCVLSLCAACAPQATPATELSTPYNATPMAAAPDAPTSSPFPSPEATPTLMTPPPGMASGSWPLIDNVAIGKQGHLYASGFGADGDGLRHFVQWHGEGWTDLGTGFRTAGNSLVVDPAGRLYTEILTDDTRGNSTAIIRWNGDGWQDITGNFSLVVDSLMPGRLSGNVPVTGLALDGEGNLYAAGMFYYPSADNAAEIAMGYVAMWNGDNWASLGEGFNGVNVWTLAATAAGDVYVSGEQPLTAEGESGYMAEWHGTEWTQIRTGNPDISLHLAIGQARRLYAAGQRTVGGAFIGYMDGTQWTTIADQLGEGPAILAMAVSPAGLLCVGGEFESVNGVPARNIACWNGAVWHPLAGGVDERVFGIAFDSSGDLYAAGYFAEAGGQPANHIARWDGERWHAAAP